MRRKQPRPYGVTLRPTRLVSLVLAVAVLWVLYLRLKDPATWRILFDLKDKSAAVEPLQTVAPIREDIVPGPNDSDEQEVVAANELFQLVNDKTPLKPREMFAYWRLMAWARTEPFTKLLERSKSDVPFTQFWEQPNKYRGKLVTLRLHVRRVLEYDAPENPQDIPVTYEAWGWTDESKSFPYVVVFPERPEGLPVGTDVRGEVVFVGYFLKVMSYTAFEANRGAPLLVGRVQAVPSSAPVKAEPMNPWLMLGIAAGGMLLIGLYVLLQMRSSHSKKRLSQRLPIDGELPDSIDFSLGNGVMHEEMPLTSFAQPDVVEKVEAAKTETAGAASAEATSSSTAVAELPAPAAETKSAAEEHAETP